MPVHSSLLFASLLLLTACADGTDKPDTGDTDAPVDADGDGFFAGEDCNDAAASIHPDATEVCDPADVDEDCDGLADAADPGLSGGVTLFHDVDGDGYGATEVRGCEATPGYVALGGDCDDADPTVHPAVPWYADDDGDGFGDALTAVASCEAPTGHVRDATDCDDAAAGTFPGADETCDGVDEDCDGAVDDAPVDPPTWYADVDADGAGDAADARVGCEQPEGYVAEDGDCDDTTALVGPHVSELCDAADLDEDCDGLADDADPSTDATGMAVFIRDADGDGYGGATTLAACDLPAGYVTGAGDCDDGDPAVSPGNLEVCDAADVDEDCDTVADDRDPSTDTSTRSTFYADADADGYGGTSSISLCDLPAEGYVATSTDCDDWRPEAHPGAPETWYDGHDDDCAGDDDDDQDGDGLAVDEDCDDTDPTPIVPTDEVYDGRDNDCDGLVDDVSVAEVAAGVLYGESSSVTVGETGWSAIGGDATGDGVDDAVIISRGGAGTAWVVSGTDTLGADGTVASYATTTISGASSSYPLTAVRGPLRDVSRDGVADVLLVGSPYASSGTSGTAYLLEGGSAGTVAATTAFATFTGDTSTDHTNVAAFGDIDGDGLYDIVVGASRDDLSYTDSGTVAVFSAASFAGAYDLQDAEDRIRGAASSNYLGFSVATGDVDGDGYEDILAGAYGNDEVRTDAGVVYWFPGNASLTWSSSADDAMDAAVTGWWTSDQLGAHVISTPGDLDGDGKLDVVINSPARDEVYVFHDPSLFSGWITPSRWSGETTIIEGDDDFGYASATSDLDGDGIDELVVGAPSDDTVGTNAGGIYVFALGDLDTDIYSGIAATSADAHRVYYGATDYAALGSSVVGGGDLDGDGREDLLVGASSARVGTAYVGAQYVILGE